MSVKRNIDNNIDNNYENQTDKKNNGFDFDKELEKVTETIKNIETWNPNTKSKDFKDKISSMVMQVIYFLNRIRESYSLDNSSNNSDKSRIRKKVFDEVITPFVNSLSKLSEKLIVCENDCYKENVLNVLFGEKSFFKEGYITFINTETENKERNDIGFIHQARFDIMKNIMEHRKHLLLNAIKNHKTGISYEFSNVKRALNNLFDANIEFSNVRATDKTYKFLEDFYSDVFETLSKFLDTVYDENRNGYKSEDHYNCLEDIVSFIGYKDNILFKDECGIYKKDQMAGYIIANLLIEKFDLRDQNKNKETNWETDYLGKFIGQDFGSNVYQWDENYFRIKIDLIKKRIKILKDGNVKPTRCIVDGGFGITYNEDNGHFDLRINEKNKLPDNDKKIFKFKTNMGYVMFYENHLENAWWSCNKIFHSYKKVFENSPMSKRKRRQYEKIKQERADIYKVFCELESEKQKLLKEGLIYVRQSYFQTLSNVQKFGRIFLLVITFPIYASVFILVKTLRKLLHCILMGLEVVTKVDIYLNDEINVKKNCKDVWAEQCENGCFDGLEINGQQINERIQWYETKNWLLVRRILFPIDLVIHIIIGIFLAIKKIFTSIIKVFVTTSNVIKDICDDNASSHIFKKSVILNPGSNSEVICNPNSKISVLPFINGHKIKVRNKFVDMNCPRTPYYDFSEKPKSAWDHFKCLTGFKSIKSAEHYDEYAHKYSGIKRLYYGNFSQNLYDSGVIGGNL